MSPRNVRPSRRLSRPVLQAEWLESRLLLAGDAASAASTSTLVHVGTASPDDTLPANLTLLSVDPAPNSTLTTSPAAVTLTFDRPVDPFSVGSNDDFDILQVNPDGTTTSLFYQLNPIESQDPTGTQLILTWDGSLAPGQYQIVLLGTSFLAGLDGSMMTTEGTDLVVTNFTIAATGVTLSDATNVGTLGESPISVQGSLDLQANTAAVSLYQFSVPQGSFWLVGLGVDAQRDGSPLASSLALFDDQGNPIATDTIGRNDYPNDPYLYAGLTGGTYYVGVSGAGNLPGQGGYNPADGDPGSVGQNQPGGPFTLQLIAEPETTSPSLFNFDVNYADPQAASPTGLTLQFSRALLLPNAGTLSTTLDNAIIVVGPSGPVPIQASSYVEGQASVSYLFDDPLPPGPYTVILPSQGELTDLAGLSPVAPGEPAGVLATFVVPSKPGPASDPTDFGPLLPDIATQGVTASPILSAGQSATYRFVVTFPALYTFTPSYASGSLSLELDGPKGTIALDGGLANTVNGTNDENLVPGVYELTLKANGPLPVAAHVVIQAPSVSWESILENGVGQGPALALRLIAPAGSASAVPPLPQIIPSSNADGPFALQPATIPTANGAGPVLTASVPAGPPNLISGLFVTLGGTVVGRPTLASNAIAASGPGPDVSAAEAALTGIPQPLKTRSGESTASLGSETATAVGADVIGKLVMQLPVTVAAMKPVLSAIPTTAKLPDIDLRWLGRIALTIGQLFATRERATTVVALAPPPMPVPAVRPSEEREQETESTSTLPVVVSVSIGIGFTAAVVLPNRRRIQRWLARRRRSQGQGVRNEGMLHA